MAKNTVIFSGTIVNMRGNDNAGSITLACPNIARARQDGALVSVVRENYPVVTYNSRTNTKEIASHFKKQDRVIVYANAQTRLRVDERGNATEFINFFAEDVEMAPNKMEEMFGIKGNVYGEPRNEVYLTGKIAGITRRTERVIQIRIDLTEERRNMMNLVYFNAPANFTDHFKIDDEVNVLGMVQTSNSRENKVVRGYHEVIVLDIAKVGEKREELPAKADDDVAADEKMEFFGMDKSDETKPLEDVAAEDEAVLEEESDEETAE